MAATAWERLARRYVSQHVYILMFLVLDCPAYREKLLIDERPGSRRGMSTWPISSPPSCMSTGNRRRALSPWRSAGRPGSCSRGDARDEPPDSLR